jgi:hypothetical protein
MAQTGDHPDAGSQGRSTMTGKTMERAIGIEPTTFSLGSAGKLLI